MDERLEQFVAEMKQKSFLIKFAAMCGCVFAIIAWTLLVIATVLWFFVILANALMDGAIALLWLIPWCAVASVLITSFLVAVAAGIFDW